VRSLEENGYAGWYVLEQDCATHRRHPGGEGPIEDVRRSIAFLEALSDRTRFRGKGMSKGVRTSTPEGRSSNART